MVSLFAPSQLDWEPGVMLKARRALRITATSITSCRTSAAGFRAAKSLPLFRSSELPLGVFSLHFAQPRSWSEKARSADRDKARALARSVLAIRPAL